MPETFSWSEPNPEVLEGHAVLFNCGPAGGTYTADSPAELAEVKALITQHNTETSQIQISAQADLAQWNTGALTTEEFEERESERAVALMEIEQQQEATVEGVPEGTP